MKARLSSLIAPLAHVLCFVFPKEKREESAGTPQQGPADIQDTGTNGQGSGEGKAKSI